MDSCFIITYSKNNMFVDVINLLYRYNFFVRYTSNKKNQYLNSATHIVINKFKILSNNILPSILPCQKIHLT